MINVVTNTHYFPELFNRVMTLDWFKNYVYAQYLVKFVDWIKSGRSMDIFYAKTCATTKISTVAEYHVALSTLYFFLIIFLYIKKGPCCECLCSGPWVYLHSSHNDDWGSLKTYMTLSPQQSEQTHRNQMIQIQNNLLALNIQNAFRHKHTASG